jgi:hypothetical protein
MRWRVVMKKLETIREVRESFSGACIDRWIMIGYRQWWTRKYAPRRNMSREKAVNERIKKLSPCELQEVLRKLGTLKK